ncbi:MAG: L,D-transpeptidase [Trebonia sp.]
MSRRVAVGAMGLALIAVGVLAAAADARAAALPAHVRLSDERTFTRWAKVVWPAPIRASPTPHGRLVARLERYTQDGFPQVYLLLESHTDRHDRLWVKLRIPGRPNGRVGWVRRNALGRFHLTHRLLVVDRRRERIMLDVYGRVVWSAPVGIGAPGTPTPAGHFWINEEFVITNRRSGYWPYALGTTDYSTLADWPGGGVVGIHGPYYDAAGIPGRISHGCIRLRSGDDAWLAHHIAIGDPLLIH